MKRVGRCLGIVLWKRPHLELWFCPEGVPEHAHPGQEVEVMVLWGRGNFWRKPGWERRREWIQIGRRTWWRWLTIPAGWLHGFDLGSRIMVFVNRTKAGSPADNFVRP